MAVLQNALQYLPLGVGRMHIDVLDCDMQAWRKFLRFLLPVFLSEKLNAKLQVGHFELDVIQDSVGETLLLLLLWGSGGWNEALVRPGSSDAWAVKLVECVRLWRRRLDNLGLFELDIKGVGNEDNRVTSQLPPRYLVQ
jgi:hypothetical protein